MTDVTLRNVKKSFGAVDVIRDVSIDIGEGEFCVFVGPSGCGKSTLLRMIAGLEDVTQGDILIAGDRVNDLPPRDRGISMVFQSYALFPHKTVFENIAYGLRIAKTPKDEVNRRVFDAAKVLKLGKLLDRKPAQLSGGQRQRVAIGRSIVRNPKVFLFDEPLSNLDAALRMSMRAEITQLHERLGATMVYVTHDQVEAMTLADKIVVFDRGKVRQTGTPMELYDAPVDTFVARFIGAPAMNLIDAETVEGHHGEVRIRLAGGNMIKAKMPEGWAPTSQIVNVGIRPEDLHVSERGAIQGKVDLVERLGDVTLVTVSLSSETKIVAKFDARASVDPGETVRLDPDVERTHFFAQDGRRHSAERSS